MLVADPYTFVQMTGAEGGRADVRWCRAMRGGPQPQRPPCIGQQPNQGHRAEASIRLGSSPVAYASSWSVHTYNQRIIRAEGHIGKEADTRSFITYQSYN